MNVYNVYSLHGVRKKNSSSLRYFVRAGILVYFCHGLIAPLSDRYSSANHALYYYTSVPFNLAHLCLKLLSWREILRDEPSSTRTTSCMRRLTARPVTETLLRATSLGNIRHQTLRVDLLSHTTGTTTVNIPSAVRKI